MALVECRECNRQVSSTIQSCPHCGFVISNGTLKSRLVRSRGNHRAQYRDEAENPAALTLGILGILFGFVFSVMAIIVGKPGKPGHKLGVIGVILWIAVVVLWLAASAFYRPRYDF